jgi:hypothetical protein
MEEAVRGGRFVDACRLHGASNCFLNKARIRMVSALLPGFSIAPALVLGEHPLPVHLPIGVLVHTGKCSRQLHLPVSLGQICLVKASHLP